jgi:hypothetical protein
LIRLDLARWGAKWGKNSKKPYFIGHEREDVVKERKKLIFLLKIKIVFNSKLVMT